MHDKIVGELIKRGMIDESDRSETIRVLQHTTDRRIKSIIGKLVKANVNVSDIVGTQDIPLGDAVKH